MLKNFFMVLVLGLLEFQESFAGPAKIDILANGQTTVLTGVLENGRIFLDNNAEPLPLRMIFRYRYQKDQQDYEYTTWEEVALRMVDKHLDNNSFEYKELKVQVSPAENSTVFATGSLLAFELNNWTLRFSNPSEGHNDEQTLEYLKVLKDRFFQGKTFHPVAEDKFKLMEWDGLYGTVEGSEIGITRGQKLVITVRFATSKASTVRMNGTQDGDTEAHYDVYHIAGLYSDTGRLVSNKAILRNIFESGNIIKYTSKGEPDGKTPRGFAECPLREVTALEDGSNGLVFGKPMVTLPLKNGLEQEGRLFKTNEDQSKITVEFKFIKEIPEGFENNYDAGKSYSIKPKTKALKKAANYTPKAGHRKSTGTLFTNKKTMQIDFVKAGD